MPGEIGRPGNGHPVQGVVVPVDRGADYAG